MPESPITPVTPVTPDTLADRVRELVYACFTAIWIESHEHQDAIAELVAMCGQEEWQLSLWDIDRGLHRFGNCTQAISPESRSENSPESSPANSHDNNASDPLAAIHMAHRQSLGSSGSGSGSSGSGDGGTSLLVLQNFHRFLGSAEIVQALCRVAIDGKTKRSIVIVLSPVVQLPVELEKLFVTVEHARPDRSTLEAIARGVATEDEELPSGSQFDAVLDASAGLTRHEAENAFSLSLVRHGRLEPSAIWEIKTQTLKKSGTLSLHRGENDFSTLGGLESLKAFTRRALLRSSRSGSAVSAVSAGSAGSAGCPVRPRGVMLLSPPGCGKSEFCKCLGQEVGRPVLMLDVGSLMGSLVGQSEERTRQALQTIDAMAPAILMIDEVEKAFAGGSGGGQNDSGVSSRMFGTFLSWLNDHDSDVFVVCTANNVDLLPPEFSRAERFDAVFFVDLPQRDHKDAIWEIYLQQFGLDAEQTRPSDEQWTGAEIKSTCRLARLLDVPLVQAAQNVVPVAITAAESVQRLRSWAEGRCLSADAPGVYRSSDKPSKRRRSVSTEPSRN